MSRFWLFSYGTLRQGDVQRAVFGRELESVDDTLTGFELDFVPITDEWVIEKSGIDRHPILRRGSTNQAIAGWALLLTAEDLDAADRYEAADYKRVQVVLGSGRDAFVYVHRDMAED